MANSGNPDRRRRIPKTNRTRDRIYSTKVTNTKDFNDWVKAGQPPEWPGRPPDGHGRSGPTTKEDIEGIVHSIRSKQKKIK